MSDDAVQSFVERVALGLRNNGQTGRADALLGQLRAPQRQKPALFVVGEDKRGKSCLTNVLLDQLDLSPVGVEVVTGAPITMFAASPPTAHGVPVRRGATDQRASGGGAVARDRRGQPGQHREHQGRRARARASIAPAGQPHRHPWCRRPRVGPRCADSPVPRKRRRLGLRGRGRRTVPRCRARLSRTGGSAGRHRDPRTHKGRPTPRMARDSRRQRSHPRVAGTAARRLPDRRGLKPARAACSSDR